MLHSAKLPFLLTLTLLATACNGGPRSARSASEPQILGPGDFAPVGGSANPENPTFLEQTLAQKRADELKPQQTETSVRPILTPATQPAPVPTAPPAATQPAATQPSPTSILTTQPASLSAAPGRTYLVDGMVGQVNGQAIYAERVFTPVHEKLTDSARAGSPALFRRDARAIIRERLDQMVLDALLLGEAERDLSDDERSNLRRLEDEKRQEIIRQYGRGAQAVAESVLQREQQKSVNDLVQDSRDQLIVQRYVRQKLWPRVNVTRRDVERYYRDNIKEYQAPANRTLHLIRTKDAATADLVAAALREKPFSEVAAGESNDFRRAEAGLMASAEGDNLFSSSAMNDAMTQLKEGEYIGPIPEGSARWFIYLDKYEPATTRPLTDVQIDIEKILREQQFRRLFERQRLQLINTGSYNAVDQMTVMLVDIAESRYLPAR